VVTEIHGFKGKKEALEAVKRSVELYKQKFGE
jgi:inorganic pyrophosphatase